MFPNMNTADMIIENAKEKRGGSWINHSIETGKCARKIAELCGMDGEKVYVLGLLHDIGKSTDGQFRHILEGYKMMSEMGYDTVAKICLTHTFPIKDITTYVGKFDVSITELEFVQNKITKYEYNDYDRLIQLCDSMVMSKGPVTLEERMKDIIMRYGSVYPVEKRQIIYSLKEYFERKIGKDIYSILNVDEYGARKILYINGSEKMFEKILIQN